MLDVLHDLRHAGHELDGNRLLENLLARVVDLQAVGSDAGRDARVVVVEQDLCP